MQTHHGAVLDVLRGAVRELGSSSLPGTPTAAGAIDDSAAGPSNSHLLLQISALHKAFLALSEAFMEELNGRSSDQEQLRQQANAQAALVQRCHQLEKAVSSLGQQLDERDAEVNMVLQHAVARQSHVAAAQAVQQWAADELPLLLPPLLPPLVQPVQEAALDLAASVATDAAAAVFDKRAEAIVADVAALAGQVQQLDERSCKAAEADRNHEQRLCLLEGSGMQAAAAATSAAVEQVQQGLRSLQRGHARLDEGLQQLRQEQARAAADAADLRQQCTCSSKQHHQQLRQQQLSPQAQQQQEQQQEQQQQKEQAVAVGEAAAQAAEPSAVQAAAQAAEVDTQTAAAQAAEQAAAQAAAAEQAAAAAQAALDDGYEQEQQPDAPGHKAKRRKKSAYHRALERCVTLACLQEAAQQERYKGQFLFPHFFILGWQKSATTSLFHHLKDHPEVLMPVEKVRAAVRSRGGRERRRHLYPLACPIAGQSRGASQPGLTPFSCVASFQSGLHAPCLPANVACPFHHQNRLVTCCVGCLLAALLASQALVTSCLGHLLPSCHTTSGARVFQLRLRV